MKDPKNPQENLLAPANPSPTFPGWGLSTAAVIVGLIWAWIVGIALVLPLGLVLALFGLEGVLVGSGTGWPWPVTNLWSLLANIGPILLLAALIAFFTARYVDRDEKTSFRPRRWPLALTAIAAGWVPFIGPGWEVLGATSLTGLLLVVVVTRYTSVENRKPIHWTKANKTIVIAGVIALAFATVSWGTVNSLHRTGDFSTTLTIGHTSITKLSEFRDDTFKVHVNNTGPFKVRVLDIKPAAETSDVIDISRAEIKLEPKTLPATQNTPNTSHSKTPSSNQAKTQHSNLVFTHRHASNHKQPVHGQSKLWTYVPKPQATNTPKN